jgi:MoxR-like ATPase
LRAIYFDGSGRLLMEFREIHALTEAIRSEVRKAVVGQDEVIDLMLASLLVGGHILLEGVPGTAKTLLAQAFAASLSIKFGRIQFTPDLMPGDVLGTNLFNFQTNSFVLTKGPIFTELLLADEINRAPPKTQAALLQAMNERQVTIDGRDYALGDDFMVVATQNPIEQQGTYPLPEAQLDRFLFKIVVAHPSRDEEREVVRRHGHRSAMPRLDEFGLRPVADSKVLALVRELVARMRLSEELLDYIVDVIRATREHASLEVGASTRAANMLAAAARAYAALMGRDFVIPDDIKLLALPVLRHRLILSAGAEIEGLSADRVVGEILSRTAAPR